MLYVELSTDPRYPFRIVTDAGITLHTEEEIRGLYALLWVFLQEFHKEAA